MHSIYILFKHTYFMLLRSLQDISQSYIKYIENALFIHDDDDDDNDGGSIIVVIIVNDGGSFKNKEKVQL